MTEERKHAILFAATLLCARKLIENIESDKPNLNEQYFIDRAVERAVLVLRVANVFFQPRFAEGRDRTNEEEREMVFKEEVYFRFRVRELPEVQNALFEDIDFCPKAVSLS